jgi:spore coat polysaccharide biosynthesis protein SpsF
MLPLLDEPMLTRVVRRTSRAATLDEVVVATTVDTADEPIVSLARDEHWALVRGSETDLLDRYAVAARTHAADIVVRITSDCPLIDPALIDETVTAFEQGGVDYASNSLEPRTFPRGLDVEVISRQALERAWRDDGNPAWREHATPYIYRHPESFRLLRVDADADYSGHRWCVDTPEDYELVRRIYAALGHDRFGWREALAIVEENPDWATINSRIVQKQVPPG